MSCHLRGPQSRRLGGETGARPTVRQPAAILTSSGNPPKALLNAKDNPVFESMLQDTYGFMFFGVPHRGAGGMGYSAGEVGAKIARFISGGRAENDLLDCLKRNSLFTRDAADRFSHQLVHYHVVSYFETVPMKISTGPAAFLSEVGVKFSFTSTPVVHRTLTRPSDCGR